VAGIATIEVVVVEEVVVEVVGVVVLVGVVELLLVDELVLVDALVEGASAAAIVVAGARESPVVAASDPQAPASNARAMVNTATAGVRSGVCRCTVRRYRGAPE